jgi:hypothetical protein
MPDMTARPADSVPSFWPNVRMLDPREADRYIPVPQTWDGTVKGNTSVSVLMRIETDIWVPYAVLRKPALSSRLADLLIEKKFLEGKLGAAAPRETSGGAKGRAAAAPPAAAPKTKPDLMPSKGEMLALAHLKEVRDLAHEAKGSNPVELNEAFNHIYWWFMSRPVARAHPEIFASRDPDRK